MHSGPSSWTHEYFLPFSPLRSQDNTPHYGLKGGTFYPVRRYFSCYVPVPMAKVRQIPHNTNLSPGICRKRSFPSIGRRFFTPNMALDFTAISYLSPPPLRPLSRRHSGLFRGGAGSKEAEREIKWVKRHPIYSMYGPMAV